VLTPATYSPGSEAGALRSIMDYHADQVQMSIVPASLSGVTVSSPESVEILPGKSGGRAKPGVNSNDSCNSSSIDCEQI
jgi:hypothetical protein